MAGEVAVTIVTVRDIFQDEAGRKSRFSDEYRNLSARIVMDRQDMAALGARDGQRLLVTSDPANGEGASIVVTAKTSEDEAHPGLAFMCNSPWSNQLVAEGGAEIPGFKSIRARVKVTDQDVTRIDELFSRIKG
ncbi:MAG TPA: molybdopterin dinucleotide binding domain-containing protein [Methanothrix sp.]|nr:formylmethanofuran dehydrogenase [Methanothrix sp.]HOV83096.1 molybdopterin dinucleotide binding domain-containing protein [Methanothrix sp.]HPC89639.1 molybdopterin dinucleotide binding domain-containing protein [Methanothrix sp.]HQE87904.1 molybdopterin dinucleotide binding domain-containing protein [Methanothrix sp.]HQI67963.1 molybdopterin dinucleotide binding domain-containing protein [Methanothrix sp.]